MVTGPVAITGASGFVGGHLVAHLEAADHRLRLLVRDPARFSGSAHTIIAGDLADELALSRLCEGAEAVVHCAGLITGLTPEAYGRVNAEGTARLVRAASAAAVRRFILVSSLAAREPALSAYGASKRKGEEALSQAGSDLSWVILRPPAVYGPGDKGTLPLVEQLSRSLAVIPGRPDARVSLIYVADLVTAIGRLLGEGRPRGSVHEVHDGREGGYSWAEMAAAAGGEGRRVRCLFLPEMLPRLAGHLALAYGRIAGKPPMLTPDKVSELYHRDWVCRNGLLDEAMDWRPEIGFAEGFRRTLDWYRAAGWLR